MSRHSFEWYCNRKLKSENVDIRSGLQLTPCGVVDLVPFLVAITVSRISVLASIGPTVPTRTRGRILRPIGIVHLDLAKVEELEN